MIGKYEVRHLGCFVRITREADLERHLRHRGCKSCRLRKCERRVGPTHHEQRDAAGVHALRESTQLRRRSHSIEAEVAFIRLDGDADISLRLIEGVRGESYFHSVSATAAGENHARLGRRKFAGEAIQYSCSDTRRLRCLLGSQLATEHAHDRHLASRPAVDPLISVEARQRPTRTYINKPRGSFVIRARIGEIELLRHHRAPAVEEVRSDRNDQSSSAEIEAGPRDAVTLAVRGNRGMIRVCIVAQMGGHSEAGEPRIEEAGETSRLVLIDEYRARGAPAACLPQFLREDLERLIPGHALELSVAPNHWPAIAIGIVETLQRGLSARAQCAAIYRMVRVALELDRSPVTSLGEEAACDRALATGRRVIGGYAGHGLIRRNEIRNEPLDFLGGASQHRGCGCADAEHLEKLTALHAIRCRGGSLLLVAHSISSDTSCNRISRGRADSTVRCDS